MRVLLFTGKGGVGKTTAAAATAVLAARRGVKTLVVSTDAAHSLGDALATTLHHEPTELETGLYAQQVDTQARFERSWGEVQRYLGSVLTGGGVDPIEADELTVLPGADEVMALLEVRQQAASGRYDLVVVDCAPSAETLRLLALPAVLRWYADRIWPIDRRIMRSLAPVLTRATGVPAPGDVTLDALERLQAELGEVQALLTDPATTSARLVLTPESVVIAESRRTYTSLTLYGYAVDGVVANRVFPTADADPWRVGWAEAQQRHLDAVRESFDPLPVRVAPYQPREPVGADALAHLGAVLYDGTDPLADAPDAARPMQVERTDEGYDLLLAVPFAHREDVQLARRRDELVLTVAGRRRIVALPSALRRCDAVAASVRDGALRVSFRPDPDQWIRR